MYCGTYHVKEIPWYTSVPVFLHTPSYLPFLYLTVIMHWFRVCSVLNTLWNILMILGGNVEQDETTCHIQEWQLWLSYFWSYLPLFCYAPNFKEVGGAYCFWVVRPSVRPSIRPSVRSSRFLMHSITLKPWMLLFWNFIYGFLMKK